MRVVLTNFGSTGDVQPFLALAVELRSHGHQPVLAASPSFALRAERLGLTFVPIGDELDPEQVRKLVAEMIGTRNPAEQMRRFLETTMVILPRMFRELRAACVDADVLVSGPTQPAGRMVHDATGIPFVSVQLHHFGVVTGDHPPPGVPLPRVPGRIGSALNRLAWRSVLAFVRRYSAPVINRYRVAEGLPPLVDPLMVDSNSPQLALFAVSRHVVRPAGDWPPHFHLTGNFFLDDDEGWKPDADLAEFLTEGKPPVVISFGSMTHEDPEAVTDLVLAAIERVGCRAVIQQGWSGLGRQALPSHVRVVGFVPHQWLFARAVCVVHHGGAGTSAAAFRAGVPSVVVPHMADQRSWAIVAEELGCAGPPVPYRRLTSERLTAAIARVLRDPRQKSAATRLGQQVRAEQGVSAARRLIEQFIVANGAISGEQSEHSAMPRRLQNQE